MPYYALFYDLVDDYLTRRAIYREEHLRLAREAHARGEMVLGGALAEPADRALLIFRGESPTAAEAFARTDPYVLNGLVKRWEVRPWTVVIGGDSITGRPESKRSS
ncbi:MAG TPA: YciI-like protein [Terriglobia bacterium]|nr:YciI-like protein [Terriglobia bacterium]